MYACSGVVVFSTRSIIEAVSQKLHEALFCAFCLLHHGDDACYNAVEDGETIKLACMHSLGQVSFFCVSLQKRFGLRLRHRFSCSNSCCSEFLILSGGSHTATVGMYARYRKILCSQRFALSFPASVGQVSTRYNTGDIVYISEQPRVYPCGWLWRTLSQHHC